jgi:hypothetical protein
VAFLPSLCLRVLSHPGSIDEESKPLITGDETSGTPDGSPLVGRLILKPGKHQTVATCNTDITP